MSKIAPITPEQVVKHKQESIPDTVIKTWNDLIAKHWTGHSANIKQTEAADAVAVALDITRQEVYNNLWLDIEDIYRAAGWEVIYDRPGWDETYEANFTFRKKRQ